MFNSLVSNPCAYAEHLILSEDSMEVDGGSINTEQLEETFMKKRVLFSLRVAEVATGQVVLI